MQIQKHKCIMSWAEYKRRLSGRDEIIQIKDLCWYACWWFTMSGVNLNLQYIFFRSNFDNHQYFTHFKDNFTPALLPYDVKCMIKMMEMMIWASESLLHLLEMMTVCVGRMSNANIFICIIWLELTFNIVI